MDRIDAMRIFVAVAEAGSFTAGARRLGISTALASKQLRKLEEHLGVRLLNRTTRSLTLTEVGQGYLIEAQRLVEDVESVEALVRDRGQTPRGHLILSAPVTYGEMYLTDTVSRFLARHPEVSVELRLTDRRVSLVEEGIDLAVRIGVMDEDSMIARRLTKVQLTVCATPSYLARRGCPSTPEELADHDCILDTNYRTPKDWRFEAAGRSHRVQVAGRFAANSARAVRSLVLAGAGIALLPVFALREELAEGRIIPLLQDFALPTLDLYALYPERRLLAPKIRAFIDVLAEESKQNTQPATP